MIELHLQGKTIREIAKEVHMSFRDISNIIKAYEKKARLQGTKKEEQENNQKIRKVSLSSQAFILYQEGKKPSEVKVLLDIPFKKTMVYWSQYLKSIRMFESFEFYQEFSYDIPTFLSINNFIKRNNISGNNIVNVLRASTDIINLNQTITNLKAEINRLEGKRISLSYYSHSSYSLQPLPLNKPNYNYYRY